MNEFETPTKKLFADLCKIAELVSKRKLDKKERTKLQKYLVFLANQLFYAWENSDRNTLRSANRQIRALEVFILSMEEGYGKKLELPKQLGDIKISGKEIKVLQQFGLMEKPSVFMQYWREIVIGILLILVLALLPYFIPTIS